jgi:hypothetical protein
MLEILNIAKQVSLIKKNNVETLRICIRVPMKVQLIITVQRKNNNVLGKKS